jgi:hypothetical protein
MSTFLFNIAGHGIAFRRRDDDKFIFDKTGKWIGWFPWGDADAVDKNGKYLGTVVGNRLLHRSRQPFRAYPGYPGYPGYAGYPGFPAFAGFGGYNPGFTDVDVKRMEG